MSWGAIAVSTCRREHRSRSRYGVLGDGGNGAAALLVLGEQEPQFW